MTPIRPAAQNRKSIATFVLCSCFSVAALAATPSVQQAIVQTGFGGPEVLALRRVPVMQPRDNEVLIRVYAATVNPADWKYRTGTGAYAPPAGAPPVTIAGADVAGVIEKLGSGVTQLQVGDPVFAIIARAPGVLNGGYAQFAVAIASNVVPKPHNLTYEQAAGLGIAGVTGVRAVNATHVASGQRVLITGVAGGVGSSAAQAAKARGAYVIGTATARHNAYLHSIGVDEVIDYSQVKFEEHVKDVDVVIDTVGDDTVERSFGTLKKGGIFISVAARDIDGKCAAAGVTCAPRGNAIDSGRAVYEETAALAAAGKLTVNIDRTFPLAEAAAAQSYGEQGHTEGKIILVVDPARAMTK